MKELCGQNNLETSFLHSLSEIQMRHCLSKDWEVAKEKMCLHLTYYLCKFI